MKMEVFHEDNTRGRQRDLSRTKETTRRRRLVSKKEQEETPLKYS